MSKKEKYNHDFALDENTKAKESKRGYALQIALDNRKFEIELYWKRATYFWTFIAAALAGYVLVQASEIEAKDDILLLLCCLGTTFSLAWFFANKGSKQWQENWENHVDMLEDELVGPLYKTVLSRPDPKTFVQKIRRFTTGPAKMSVSKINQILSLYITFLWGLLLVYAILPLNCDAPISWKKVSIISITVIAWITLKKFGETHTDDVLIIVDDRVSNFVEDE